MYLQLQGWEENTSPTFEAEAPWPAEEGLEDVIRIEFYREEKEFMRNSKQPPHSHSSGAVSSLRVQSVPEWPSRGHRAGSDHKQVKQLSQREPAMGQPKELDKQRLETHNYIIYHVL